jgi:glycerophosphoryl diester phosphodiesterase
MIMSKKGAPFVWGHRGAAAICAENTVASFVQASQGAVDGVEMDVQLSRDGVVVVLHDATLDRTTTGSGWVGQYTWNELQQLRARHPDGRIAEFGIPRLEEVLEALSPQVALCIEYKNGPHFYPDLVPKTLEVVRAYRAQDRTMVSSFDQFALVESARLAPEIPRAVAWGMGRMIAPWQVGRQAQAIWLHVHKDSVPFDDLRRIKEEGMLTAVWGLKSAEDAQALDTQYVDAVFVDDPAWVASLS